MGWWRHIEGFVDLIYAVRPVVDLLYVEWLRRTACS